MLYVVVIVGGVILALLAGVFGKKSAAEACAEYAGSKQEVQQCIDDNP